MKISAYSAKGPRDYQEDSYRAITNEFGTLLAVFDGHGGSKTSTLLTEKLEEGFGRAAMYRNAHNLTDSDMMVYLFDFLNSFVKDYKDGSTASIVYINKNKVTVGVLGDSPILITFPNAYFLAPEHNIRSNKYEANEAIKRGGYIQNGYLFNDMSTLAEGLQMSRAFGDANLHPVVIQIPEIITMVLDKTSKILVASDGLFDPGHGDNTNTVKTMINALNSNADAKSLVDYRLENNPQDNVTAIVASL